jgi:hypothetical protein
MEIVFETKQFSYTSVNFSVEVITHNIEITKRVSTDKEKNTLKKKYFSQLIRSNRLLLIRKYVNWERTNLNSISYC